MTTRRRFPAIPVVHPIEHHQLVLGLPVGLRGPRVRRRVLWTRPSAPAAVERAA